MSRENVTDILCIGAQRAMTSWLHQAVAVHPGTWSFPNFEPLTSTRKEAHYWDWNHQRGQDWYRVLMRPLDDALQSLDFTPEYAFLTDREIDECKALNPRAKVLYILRDPLARAVSAIRMRTVWASKGAPADEVTITYGRDFLERCKNALLWDHGAYAANLRRWRRRYSDLLVVNFEDLRADPRAGLQRILAHCGLATEGLDAETLAALDERAARHVWVTPGYRLSADCLHFLHGAVWPEYEAIQAETGLTFAEGAGLLAALP